MKHMGNLTNEENWAARERLRMIEVLLWWRGWVRRGDLLDCFGISAAQASGDIQRFLELNRNGVIYHPNRKRYEASESFTCRLHRPSLTEAVTLLFGQNPGHAALAVRADSAPGQTGDLADIVTMPQRVVNDRAVRVLVMALLRKEAIEARYVSVNSSTRKTRTLMPRALGYDGSRWHARCWDTEQLEWRDYVLGRMEECKWSRKDVDEPPADVDWDTFVTLKLKPNSSLSKEAKAALKMDYGMTSDTLELRVRKAMVKYVRHNLGLPWDANAKEPWASYFQVVSEKKEA
jgi:predicted DNA-binding transcriptional regulator YafY